MKKTLILIFLALIVLLSGYSVFAQENRAQIEFCVGDDTLIINEEPIKVEKPYVVGAGVTLVPVRVITEAFGSKVGWDSETKTVTIDYPDVNIVLRIGDQIAEVNGRAETLLSAPELSIGGFTMIPLRFISENFGASVSYENETGKITVIKEDKNANSTIQTKVNNEYIGDSYYGWRMKNSPDFEITERFFGGDYTNFNYDANNDFYVEIVPFYKEYDFEKDFAETKSMFTGYALVTADKNTSDSNKKIYRIQGRSKETFIDLKRIITDKYIFSLFGSFENDKTEYKNSFGDIVDTFDSCFEGDDIYDMSEVKDGFRRFVSETLNISFNVFDDYVLTSYDDSVNSFTFKKASTEADETIINLEIYSKDSDLGAESLANEDFNNNKTNLNEDIVKFDDSVVQKTYGKLNVYEYNFIIDAAFYSVWYKDVFFEKGDYVYNMTISFELPQNDVEELATTILNSVELSEIDAANVGRLLRNNSNVEGTYISTKLKNCSITLPNNYSENQNMNYVHYVNMINGIVITAFQEFNKDGYTFSKTKDVAKDVEKMQKADENVKAVVSTTECTVGNIKGYKHVLSIDDAEIRYRKYIENYFIYNSKNKTIYIFSVEYPETAYSNRNKKEISDILNSIVFK